MSFCLYGSQTTQAYSKIGLISEVALTETGQLYEDYTVKIL